MSLLISQSLLLAAAMSFKIGDYSVRLQPYRDPISPNVTFAGKTFQFAYRTGGHLKEGDVTFGYDSVTTNTPTALSVSEKEARVEYVQTLVAKGKDGATRLVGWCSNEVVFAERLITVRATLHPAEPGRYRFHSDTCGSQCIVFADFNKRWAGSTLDITDFRGTHYMNELMTHDRFDPKAWGLGWHETGPGREVVFGNVPDVISFRAAKGARVNANRYPGGFEMSAAGLNPDVMHKPFWNKPYSWSYTISLEK